MHGSSLRGSSAKLTAACAAAVLLSLSIPPAEAGSELGSQRVGTSSGVFLKVPIDARSSAMAGATTSSISGPAAMFVNPAGLGLEHDRAALLSGIRYVADIPMGATAIALPIRRLGGSLGLAISGVFAEMDETDEYHPLGTGRSFSYSAWALAVGFSRPLTDKLSCGASVKLFSENLATEIGGTSLMPVMLDAGAIYYVGYRDARIGIAINNFGPDLRPAGQYTSRRTGSEMRYGSFSPPTLFRFGFSIDPVQSEHIRTLMSIDMGHLADNQEAIRLAGEAILEDHFVVRAGYDFSADAFKFNGGFGALMAV
ncbi:MAG: PorV/PorQ family protein, partial [Candidatus Eisenbacteria sp.]|nr:PorV/PorQ family protein [Candidatus Eisenbacteria bacterium]